MNAPWSPQQREWLQALGHDVLVLATAGTTPMTMPAVESAAGPAAPVRSSQETVSAGSPLMRAILKAAGRRDAGELADWLPDPDALRGDAAAKRALWPRLRALRRKPRA